MRVDSCVLVLCLSVTACETVGGRGYCETCNLDEQIAQRVSSTEMSCGEVGIDEGPESAVACIEQALADGTHFSVRQELQGIDSSVSLAWMHDEGGVLQRLSYDSNICGGGDGCTRQCGPRVSMSECVNPRVGALPEQSLIDCDDAPFTTLCEPPE